MPADHPKPLIAPRDDRRPIRPRFQQQGRVGEVEREYRAGWSRELGHQAFRGANRAQNEQQSGDPEEHDGSRHTDTGRARPKVASKCKEAGCTAARNRP